MPAQPPGEPYEYSLPLLPTPPPRPPKPLPALVKINAVLHALVRHALTTTPTPTAALRIVHQAVGHASHSTLSQLTPSGWQDLPIADSLHTHLATLRARTVLSGTPPWFIATIEVTPQPAASDDPFNLETTFDLTHTPTLLRPLSRVDYEDDLNFFPRNLTQMPDWFIAGLLAPADAAAAVTAQALIRSALLAAVRGELNVATAAFEAIAVQSFVAAPLALAIATRAVTYTHNEPSGHPPLGTPSLIASTDPSTHALAQSLLPTLVADLRDELVFERDGAELVTRVAATTTLLTALAMLCDQPPETVGYLVDQAWVDYTDAGQAEYFAQTMAHIRDTSAQLFHTWATAALLVSIDPTDRTLAARHCALADLAIALDDEQDPAVLVAMLAAAADHVSAGSDLSDALPGINTACYRLLARHCLADDVPALRTLISTGALAISLYTRLAHPPVHPRIRAAALSTGLADPAGAILALAAKDPSLRTAAVYSGQLSPAQLGRIQLQDPDLSVATAATHALSRTRHIDKPPPTPHHGSK
jgi:hypothetical protein